MDPLREQAVVILQPGEELDPIPYPTMHYMLSWWKPDRPGLYSVRCIYDGGDVNNEPTEHPYFRWSMSSLTPTLVRMLDRTPHGRVVSNEVSITVEE